MFTERADYYLSVDLGQAQDYTAIAVVEEPVYVRGDDRAVNLGVRGHGNQWIAPDQFEPELLDTARAWEFTWGRPSKPPLNVRHLERLPLGTPYPEVVRRVAALLASSPLRERVAVLVLDLTGVGRPVFDMFIEGAVGVDAYRGLRPVGITLHGGDQVTVDKQGYRVPKRDLIAAAQAVLQTGRLKVAQGLPEAATLAHELRSFRVKIDARSGHDSYAAWREQDHDDLVLAVAQAVWLRERWGLTFDPPRAQVWEQPMRFTT